MIIYDLYDMHLHLICRTVFTDRVTLVKSLQWHLETSGAFDHSKAWRLN